MLNNLSKEYKEKLNSRKIGVTIRGELIQMLRFTDDIALITKNKKKWRLH